MNVRKFAVADSAFYDKMLGACKTPYERGMIMLLYHTGMHGACLLEARERNLHAEGSAWFFRWNRPKTGKYLEARIPPECLSDIRTFLKGKKHGRFKFNSMIKEIGQKAGFQGVTPMTFRHTRCFILLSKGHPVPVVAQKLGCSLDVVMSAYSKLSDEQLREIE